MSTRTKMEGQKELQFYKCTIAKNFFETFKMPKNYKQIFASNLQIDKVSASDRDILEDIKDILSTGVTRDNYIRFFHILLWYEETILRINLKGYNNSCKQLTREDGYYTIAVPGLAEKRPSLVIGDYVLIIPQKAKETIFEAVINDISENTVSIQGLNKEFLKHYDKSAKFNIRFILSRTSLERMHQAVHSIKNVEQESRTFPHKSKKEKRIQPITSFFNKMIGSNTEQRIAVERIVANASSRSPYLLHGPPGTGKTVTIVEAILQLVKKNSKDRILVCTDSNMAADHVAACLVKYRKHFAQKKFLLRANSRLRAWETLPECVVPYSNGTSRDDFNEVDIKNFMSYNITITTLSHSATFARRLKFEKIQRYITHLFIDEAAQASEPISLIPICGLLTTRGSLVLAGDPLQLGPTIVSHSAREIGLGLSLMERLQNTFPMYSVENSDNNYTVMLRDNFRSSPDILLIPNALFYKGQLNAKAEADPISKIDILQEGKESRAIIFHGILSKEERSDASPSFFNYMELEVVQMYVSMLVQDHAVQLEDIGVVTPYKRQMNHR